MPYLYLYSPSDFETPPPAEAGASAAGSGSWTLTLKPGAQPTAIEIIDDDGIFDEVDNQQALTEDAVVDGTCYPAGTTAHSSYDLLNSDTGHKITGVHLGTTGYGQGAVHGIISTEDLVPGESYTFDTERTSHRKDNAYEDYTACFAAGTLIATADGQTPIETLSPGDLVQTASGLRPIRMVLTRTLNAEDLSRAPKLRPIRIAANALQNGTPRRDLYVSRQHRMLIASQIGLKMFGTNDVFIAAHRLLTWPGVETEDACAEVTYVHLVLDAHQIVYAEGAPTESFYCGPVGLAALPAAQRDELLDVFPELRACAPQPAAVIPSGARQTRFAKRCGRRMWPAAHP